MKHNEHLLCYGRARKIRKIWQKHSLLCNLAGLRYLLSPSKEKIVESVHFYRRKERAMKNAQQLSTLCRPVDRPVAQWEASLTQWIFHGGFLFGLECCTLMYSCFPVVLLWGLKSFRENTQVVWNFRQFCLARRCSWWSSSVQEYCVLTNCF